jgi:hypothetical protein
MPETATGIGKGVTYCRQDETFSLDVPNLELTGIPAAEEDLWLPAERPSGRLPWETKNPKTMLGVRGSNMDDLVGTAGFEPATPRL